jgi:hypothetical protein
MTGYVFVFGPCIGCPSPLATRISAPPTATNRLAPVTYFFADRIPATAEPTAAAERKEGGRPMKRPPKGGPRIEDRAKTIEARKPWLKLGMSRRTWYRRQAEKRKGRE